MNDRIKKLGNGRNAVSFLRYKETRSWFFEKYLAKVNDYVILLHANVIMQKGSKVECTYEEKEDKKFVIWMFIFYLVLCDNGCLVRGNIWRLCE